MLSNTACFHSPFQQSHDADTDEETEACGWIGGGSRIKC